MSVVPASAPASAHPAPVGCPHDHVWELRETEYDECGMTLNRFECDCGQVSYV